MKITPNIEFVNGSFDTKTTKMVCIHDKKYLQVRLGMKTNNDKGWTLPVAKLSLTSSETVSAVQPIYDDLCNLGDEIARRWNECETKL